jgi:hypothetical protein
MFTLWHQVGFRRSLATEVPYLIVAIVVAEVFYKFHSFTLECLAFLATWCALSAVASWVWGRVGPRLARK